MSNLKQLNSVNILKHTKTKNLDISVLPCVTSTNKILKEMAFSGEKEGKAIVALSQTEGHGRYDRKFYSDFGGLYISLLLKPDLNKIDITLLTSAVAVAVSNAIDEISNKTTSIKWVNDILLDSKKVCGILCEGGFCGNDGFVVVGVGINACPVKSGFNEEIKNIATTVFDDYSKLNMARLCAKVIDNIFFEYESIWEKRFLDVYRQKSSVLGKTVDLISNGKKIDTAKVLEIDDRCRLTVKLSSGEIKTLLSEEISIKDQT